MALDPAHATRLRTLAKRRDKLDAEWRAEIIAAVRSGASLREVGEAAGISHTAVNFIVNGRPSKRGV